MAASSAGGSSNLRSTSRSVASGRVRGPSRRPRTTSTAADPRHRRPRARASADPGRRWIGRTRQFAETRLDRGRPARLPSRPRPTPRPASRSARAACPHPSLASSTSVRATCGSTSWSPAGSEPYPIPHAASSSRLMPSTRVAIATLVATPRTPRSCQLGFGCWQDGWLDRMRLVAGRRRPCRLLAADDRRADEMMFTGKSTERAGAPLDFCIASCVVHRGSGRWRAAGRDGC